VSIYEKDYPNITFVISDLGPFYNDVPALSSSPFATWPVPSLALARGTWLGAFDLGHFEPPLITIDQDCNVSNEFSKPLQKPMEDLVDAFLYLGPPNLSLNEQMPADIALDVDYRKELQRREVLWGFPGAPTRKGRDQEILKDAENPVFVAPKPPDLKEVKQSCLDLKKSS
jgi:hypothetical protein